MQESASGSFCSLEVNHQLKLGEPLDWQVGGFVTFENVAVRLRDAVAVTHQGAIRNGLTP